MRISSVIHSKTKKNWAAMSYIFVLLEQRPERDPIIFFLPWRLKVNTNNIHTLGWRKAFLLLCHHSRKEISYLSTNTLGVTFIYGSHYSFLSSCLSVWLLWILDFTFNLSVSMFESEDFPCSWWVKLVFVFTLYQ